MQHDESYARYAYVTYEDLELLNHPRFYKDFEDLNSSDNDEDEESATEDEEEDSQMILAIRAPPGSKIHIPDTSNEKEMDGLLGYLSKKYKISIDARRPTGIMP